MKRGLPLRPATLRSSELIEPATAPRDVVQVLALRMAHAAAPSRDRRDEALPACFIARATFRAWCVVLHLSRG